MAHAGPGRDVAVPASRSDNVLAMLLEAARDPSIDADKVKTMADLGLKLQDRERETRFAQDFAAAVMDMPYISKTNQIVIPAKDGRPERVQGMFASFENLDRVVRPILARHNLVISFKLGSDGGGTTCVPILTHTLTGYRDVGDALRVPPDTSGSKNAAQAIGSSASYAKRYAMCAALNIVTIGEDTDGRGYPLADDPLSDRQQRLVAEAEASHADGNYAEWFGKQTAKDKQWLILRGVHARMGGAALPGQSNRPEEAPATAEKAEPEPTRQPVQDGGHDISTPEGWTAKYIEDCERAPDREALQRVQAKGANGLARLKAAHTTLHAKAVKAGTDALARITGGKPTGGSDLFEEGGK